MSQSNQIAEFFNHLYLWKETNNDLDFWRRDSSKGKIGTKNTAVHWVWSDVLNHAQACLGLSGVNLFDLRIGMAHCK